MHVSSLRSTEILTKRVEDITQSIKENNYEIAKVGACMELFHRGNASVEVKVLNTDTWESIYTVIAFMSPLSEIRDAVRETLTSYAGMLSCRNSELHKELGDLQRALSSMGLDNDLL
jgi:hypothetical protein